LYSFFPDLSEAICCVRNIATGAVKQALASKLIPISYGKDAYLLEVMREEATLFDILRGGR
jgi:hypothetical protein